MKELGMEEEEKSRDRVMERNGLLGAVVLWVRALLFCIVKSQW